MMTRLRTRSLAAVWLPVLFLSAAGCDIVTAEYGSQESAEWRKTYDLKPGGRVEIHNVNGKIDVEPSGGDRVEVVAQKTAKAGSPEAAKEALARIEIVEDASPDAVRIETKVPRSSGLFRASGEVRYLVKVPPNANAKFRTVNGGIEIAGLDGRVGPKRRTAGSGRARSAVPSMPLPPTAASRWTSPGSRTPASTCRAPTAGSSSACRPTQGQPSPPASLTAGSVPRGCRWRRARRRGAASRHA
jgi:hypothetical protein